MRHLVTALFKIVAKDLDLSNYDATKEWAIENIDGVSEIFEEDEQSEEDDEQSEEDDEEKERDAVFKKYDQQRIEDRISDYMYKYREVKNATSVELYRAVCLDDIKEIDFDDIGMHWSFEKEGAGCYGDSVAQGENTYILTGTTSPKNIDWEYGFTSYMWYGEDQWECALDSDSEVLITHIDDKKLDKPIKAKTTSRLGYHEEIRT